MASGKRLPAAAPWPGRRRMGHAKRPSPGVRPARRHCIPFWRLGLSAQPLSL